MVGHQPRFKIQILFEIFALLTSNFAQFREDFHATDPVWLALVLLFVVAALPRCGLLFKSSARQLQSLDGHQT